MQNPSCPKCSQRLQTRASEGPRIATCSGCAGLWLDAGSLGAALEDPSVLWKALAAKDADTSMPCPACAGRTLRRAKVGHCELDWCPSCQGVFFDRGEIDRVRAARERPGEPNTLGIVGETTAFAIPEMIVEAICWAIASVADSL